MSGQETKTSNTNLILVALIQTISIPGVHSNLLVIFLQSSHIFPRLRELAFLHTLTHVPVDESPLCIHKIELVIKPGPGLSDGRGVGKHTNSSLHLGEVTSRYHGGRLVVYSNLESSRTPVHELYTALTLDSSDGSIYILRDHVTSVQHTASHVLPMSGVALNHRVGRLEARVGDFGNIERLVVGLLSRDNWSVGNQREVDPGVGNQVCLELVKIYVQSSIESERGRDGGHNLADQSVEVGVARPLNVEVTAADIVDGLVIHHEGAVR